MSAEKIGVRWNTYENSRNRFVEKETSVVGGKCLEKSNKSPRPPLPDLIPIRKSILVRSPREKNRHGHRYHDVKADSAWTHDFMETCQQKRQMFEEEKVSIYDGTLRNEENGHRGADGTSDQSDISECGNFGGNVKCGENTCVNNNWVEKGNGVEVWNRNNMPSVNPVFLWVVQNDTEIVNVRCEDYDKRNRIRLTKTASGTWKATPRTHMQSDGAVDKAKKRKKKKKKSDDARRDRKKRHRKEKKQKKRKHDQVHDEVHIEASFLEKDEGAHVLESGEKLETLASIERFGRTSEMNDRAAVCTSENKARDVDVSTMQQNDVVEMQQMQEQEHYINAIHDISHENEQPAHILSDSVYETFEVDTVVNCVQNSCKDNQEEPSLFQDTHILLDVDITSNSSHNQCNQDANTIASEKKEVECEEKYLPFSEDDAQQNFKQESFTDNLNVTSELIETIREISVSNSEDLDLTDQCGENTMTGTELLDSLIEHSCEVNNISGNIDDVKQPTACDVEDDYNEEDELLLDSEPVANIISRLSDSPKCLSFTESGEIETILESSNNIFKIGSEQSLDDLSLTIKELTDSKFMNTSRDENQKNMSEITSLLSPDSCVDEMPKDLSCKAMNQQRSPSPQRPISRGSDTIQSPQPSGLPPIPPSPDIYSQHNRLLHNNLPTASPKLVDGGRRSHQENSSQQPEPLNLGVCRKSASPTVSCSEEAKNLLNDLTTPVDNIMCEPVKKRLKSDTFKTDNQKIHTDKVVIGKDPDPLTQLRLLMSNSEWKVPSTLLVPKDRLNAVLASPAREIPLLLTTRPELRLPEAFAFPTILQDPDILVVSLSQLETILEKQEELFKLKDSATEATHQKKASPAKFTPTHHNSELPERQRHAPHQSVNQHHLGGKVDIDPSTLNIFNQMLWLPYFNQLRNQNMGDFMKTPNMRNIPGAFPDLFMLLAAQNNLSNLNNINGQMPQNFMGCNTPLELALWQDAMLQESNMNNIQQLQRLNADRQTAKKYTPKQNLTKMPQYQQKNHPMHCMSNQLGNFRFAGQHQKAAANSGFATSPTYTPRGCSNMQSHMKNSTLPFVHPHAIQGGSKKNHSQSATQMNNNFSPHFPAGGFGKSEFEQMNHHAMQKAKEEERISRQKYQSYQEARTKSASYQSLLNLLNPSLGNFAQEDKSKQMHTTNTATNSSSTVSQSQQVSQPKLKVKSGQHLLDPAAMQRRLLATDDLSEVGSTTNMADDGTDANSSLWHPLFGRDLNNFSPQKSGGYISPWQWTTVTIAGE